MKQQFEIDHIQELGIYGLSSSPVLCALHLVPKQDSAGIGVRMPINDRLMLARNLTAPKFPTSKILR